MAETKILVVEDEGLVAKSIQNMLTHLGYDAVGTASSGKRAVQKAKELRPDLILMDIKLRGEMDGIEAADKIRESLNIPVVYLTAYADKKTLQRAKVTEPFGYLLKPFEERDLHSTIETALYKYKMEKKLMERERWFSTVLRSIGDGVVATDKKGSITFVNSVAEELTGWKQKETLGKDVTDRFKIVMEDQGATPKELPFSGEGKKTKKTFANQAILIGKKKSEVPIDFSDAPIKDEEGRNLGSVVVFRDVSERKQAQEELRRSYERLRRTLDETVQSLASAVEMRDPYTAGHQKRVAELSCAIADEIGLTDDQIEGIRMAGIIHDIGKIYVPSEILSKPSRLDEAEIALIRKHPQVGYEILKGIEFPWPIAEIVLQHHERMLGDGYPSGLRGEDILLEARIIAVADVVEAMSSHRPYRPALGIEWTLEEIRKNRGILYDPIVVDACLKIFMEDGFKFEEKEKSFKREVLSERY
jgi:PAS domain S-box-containing protein/putative nucleotidyltransferase with HDIG domain